MIIEDTGLNGLKSELKVLDEAAGSLGFVRWQWGYYRATYDYEHDDDYILRINTRVTEGKLEDPVAVLEITDVYAGKKTFPHGVDYDIELPSNVMKTFRDKLDQLKQKLS